MNDFKTQKRNFLGVRNIKSDIKDIPKQLKILLLVAIVIILFFNFFDVQGGSHGGGENWFSPLFQYNQALNQGSTFGSAGDKSQAIAVAVLYSLNGLASFTGILQLAMIIRQKSSQFFWLVINATFFGLFSISVGYLGNMIMQIILILGAPIGWYLLEIKGMATRDDKRKSWLWNLIFFAYVAIIITIMTLVIYEFLPSAFDTIFGKTGSNNPYVGNDVIDTLSGKVLYRPTTFRVIDSITNGFNVVGYMFQLTNAPQQFYVWIFVDILKLISFTGISGSNTLSVNMLIEFIVWTSIASYGLFDRNIKPVIEHIKNERHQTKTL